MSRAAGTLAALSCALATRLVAAAVTQDCALARSDCTLAETAAQAHVRVGAIDQDQDGDAERALRAAHFNSVTAENAMKWGELAPRVGEYDFTRADAVVERAARAGLRLRGHTLVWGRLQLPADLEGLVGAAGDPAARLREIVAAHIATVVGRYRGRVAVWDVVNEPLAVAAGTLDPNLFLTTLGESYIAEAFRLAHALDPDAALFLNEFLLAYTGDKADGLRALVRRLRDAGVPVHGVGIQAHFFPLIPLPTRAEFEGFLRSLADLGVTIALTELDVAIWHFRDDADPLVGQAIFYADVVAACMAVPACEGLTTWGLTDAGTWLDGFPPWTGTAPNLPLLFDGAGAPKPAYFAVRTALRARAVPFATRGADLLARYRTAVTRHAFAHLSAPRRRVQRGRRALVRVRRLLANTRYDSACVQLAGVETDLRLATGAAAADLRTALAGLHTDLRCDSATGTTSRPASG